jgi:hypothetical protein
LLHKHDKFWADELTIERETEVKAIGACLVTKPAMIHEHESNLPYPNSWKLARGQFVPLEYSVDERVCVRDVSDDTLAHFMDEFALVLDTLDLIEIMGPCIITRTYYCARRPPSWILIETNDPSLRANVLRFGDPKAFITENLIVTSWVALEDSKTVCKPHCEPGSCIEFSACVVDEDGKHRQKTNHSKGDHAKQHIETSG